MLAPEWHAGYSSDRSRQVANIAGSLVQHRAKRWVVRHLQDACVSRNTGVYAEVAPIVRTVFALLNVLGLVLSVSSN